MRDANQPRRLLALASILDGASRSDAARNAGMDWQTLRDWVHRYNAEGVGGLLDRRRSGRGGSTAAARLFLRSFNRARDMAARSLFEDHGAASAGSTAKRMMHPVRRLNEVRGFVAAERKQAPASSSCDRRAYRCRRD